MRAAGVRGAGFAAVWVALTGTGNMPTGLATAAAAAWLSLHLLPPGELRLRPVALPRLALRFAWRSLLAGWDVAWRAFDPRLPLRPGFVTYRAGLAPGPARSAFAALSSLLPGSLPAGEEGEALLYHCLDVGEPVAAQLAVEEAALRSALAGGRDA